MLALLPVAIGIVVLLVIACVPPGRSALYPPYVFHLLTGLYCPGCGSARCLSSLTQGHLWRAFEFNPVDVLLMPWLLYLAFGQVRYAISGVPPQRRLLPAAVIWIILGAVIAYWIARNLPWYPFRLLAPH